MFFLLQYWANIGKIGLGVDFRRDVACQIIDLGYACSSDAPAWSDRADCANRTVSGLSRLKS